MKPSEIHRGSIISLHRVGRTNAQRARQLHICKQTVSRWLQRHKDTRNLTDKPRTGRPPCTTSEQDQQIRIAVEKNPLTTSLRVIEHQNLWKPHLTEANIEKRLEYALEFCEKPAIFWENVVFLDEKTFYSTNRKATKVWRKNGTRYDGQHVVSDGRSGRIGAALFGWVYASGVGELTDIGRGRFTGVKYVKLLEDVFLPSVRLLNPYPSQFFLLQDNSPIHNAEVVKNWFKAHPEINVLPLPPRSPDLNQFEHVWAAMEKQASDPLPLGSLPNRNAVIQKALAPWEHQRGRDAGQALCLKLTELMPRRLNSVIEAGGAYTKY
ncbi:hypothetical protein Pcinc_020769 [Petrolisthes cinctipes]|uniref:Tc1-like transposase DDE domain-containing protein n=1 Tax=Petrolisthes cinctipes TaxID=88211 RepID=A0AAE1KJB8_PETCI|nr:hypothetical protein Pcinc_020769 [Petrolisthes cinctipes]